MKNCWKKIMVGAIAGAMLLTGCGGAQESTGQNISQVNGGGTEGQDQLARIQEAGEMTIAMEGTWAPWTYHDENDDLVGFDVEVGKAIAEKLGVEPVFIEGEWDGLLAGLEAGRFDIMVNGVEYTDERGEKYDFSEPYGYIRTAIMVKEDNAEIQSFEDLAGKTTANTISSTYAQLAESYGATATGVDDLNQTMELLIQGRVDATLNAEVTFYDYLAVHPDADVKIAALTEDASHVCIPMRKGDDSASLREAVNQAIIELREEGVLAEISEKYFGTDITAVPAE
ncbi:MAG: transporter substrate-binding domain-containing protein [Lachnospiraceae bacterium]|nr:transporter substrate-binding domain-containing protein [Lachnospiraceae bacterium]